MKNTLITVLALATVIVSLLGIVDTTYLTYEKFTGQTIKCGVGWDCGKVLSSQWSMVGPVPLSLLGVAFYTVMFLLSICFFLQLSEQPLSWIKKLPVLTQLLSKAPLWISLLMLASSIGFGCSLVFVSLMAFVIGAWCKFCVLSAVSSTLLFILCSALYLAI